MESANYVNELETPRNDQRLAKVPHPLSHASKLNFFFLSWLDPLIRKGYSSILQESDVWENAKQDSVQVLMEKFYPIWQSVDFEKDKLAFGKAVWKTFQSRMLIAVILLFTSAMLNIVQPFFVKSILQILEDREPIVGWDSPYFLVAGLGILSLTSVSCLDFAMFLTTRIGSNVRSLCIYNVFQSMLYLPNQERQEITSGDVVTLASLDAERMFEAYVLGLHSITATISLVIVMVLVGMELDVISAICGAGFMILSVALSFKLGHYVGHVRQKLLKITSERVRVSSETLQGIRVIKFNCWEQAMAHKLESIRKREIKMLRKFHLIRIINRVMMLTMPNTVAALCFVVHAYLGYSLTVSQTFSVLAFFNAARLPAAVLPNAITFVAEGFASSKRIGRFLRRAPHDIGQCEPNAMQNSTSNASQTVIALSNADFSWSGISEVDKTESMSIKNLPPSDFSLRNISVNIKQNALVMVVGVVGSGKSSLLLALMGEMTQMAGVRNIQGKFSYAGQRPWIQNTTIRKNIMFYDAMDNQRYNDVIRVSHLTDDLTMFPNKDDTEIGEFGITVSGGQKARVSVARALYRHEREILLLDDPLSALDVHTAHGVFQDAILTYASNRTRILVLNSHYQLLEKATNVIVMDNGKIGAIGSYHDIIEQYPQYKAITNPQQVPSTSLSLSEVSVDEMPRSTVNGEKEKEDRVEGAVSRSTYIKYFESSGLNGFLVFSSIILLFSLAQLSQAFSDFWIGQWAKNDGNWLYESIYYYIIIVVLTGILVGIRSAYFIGIAMLCSRKLHDFVFGCVLRAKVNLFFDITPVGRILNRFSRDLDQIDSTLPIYYSTFLQFLFQVIAVFIVCAWTVPIALVVYVPMGIAFRYLQLYYQRTSREIKRLDGITRSPILNMFSESIVGLPMVRAFDMQKRYCSLMATLVDNNTRFFFIFGAAGRWLAMRLDWVSSVLIVTVSAAVLATKDSVNIALAGLAMVYAVQLTTFLQRMVWLANATENTMTAVERLDYYSQLPFEDDPSQSKDVPPQEGRLQLINVCMRYRPGLDLVLVDINLDISPGEKINIIGKSGSGKSSLIAALFRFADCEAMSSILINSVDSRNLSRFALRRQMCIVPQDPMLFGGSLRSNLDPFNDHSDLEVWNALALVQLNELIKTWEFGLDSNIAEMGDNLSVGQRQLVCIARALLREASIVVLDEATASVDMESEKMMHGNFFVNKTVISIAHRLNNIMQCDRVVVMDAGRIIECDAPSILYSQDSMFRKMMKKANVHCNENL